MHSNPNVYQYLWKMTSCGDGVAMLCTLKWCHLMAVCDMPSIHLLHLPLLFLE